jgi:hypothetical protein
MSSPGEDRNPVITCGEVRTCLLPTRDALDERRAGALLRLRPDERVGISRHPNRSVASPDILTGVDCVLPTDTGTRVRAVGTVRTHALLVEGRVLQSTAFFSLPAAGAERRHAWGYYLARPGCLVPIGRLPRKPVGRGFLLGHRPGQLDIGSIAEGMLARVCRRSRILDHDPPLTTADTHLRWTAVTATAGEQPSSLFTKGPDGLRTVELRLPSGVPPTAAVKLCEDLALHDWLLTTVADRLDGLRTDADTRAVLTVVRPLVDHLLHLWMPGARVDRTLRTAWRQLEETPGYSRQWKALTQRIRDQLALRAIHL